jgi:hypothetical protein
MQPGTHALTPFERRHSIMVCGALLKKGFHQALPTESSAGRSAR